MDLDVDVLGAAWVLAGDHRLQRELPARIRRLVAAQPVPAVVVKARRVGLPEIQDRVRDRLAVESENKARYGQAGPAHTWIDQRGSFRRSGLEVGSFRLGRR